MQERLFRRFLRTLRLGRPFGQEVLFDKPRTQRRDSSGPAEHNIDLRRIAPEPSLQLGIENDHAGSLAPVQREASFEFSLQNLSGSVFTPGALSIEKDEGVSILIPEGFQVCGATRPTARIAIRMWECDFFDRPNPERFGPRQ